MEHVIYTAALSRFAEGAAPDAGTGALAPQPAPRAAANTADAPAEGPEKIPFDALLQDPDYRRDFDSRVRAAVTRRFRTLQARRADLEGLARTMADRCGVAVGEGADLSELRRAIESIPAQNGEGACQSAPQEDGHGEAETERAFRAAAAEGEALRALYPDFDLGRELGDPRFASLLVSLQRCGAPEAVRLAYEGAHHAALLYQAVQRTAERTAAAVAEGVRSGALRPAENGGSSPAELRTDPARLTEAERRDIRRRVLAGERVTF